MIAVVVCRDGGLPAGAAETVAEAGQRALVIGDGAERAGALLPSAKVLAIGRAVFAPAAYAAALAPLFRDAGVPVLLPGSPDGRDLAPRLAAELGWPLYAGCYKVGAGQVGQVRLGGRVADRIDVHGPFVATLIPGVRGVAAASTSQTSGLAGSCETRSLPSVSRADPTVIGVMPPDPVSIDLAEAVRIVAGGQGLGSIGLFELLGRIGAELGASLGGTRVASDAGWISFERQIGTTGVAVSPRLYVAFGISGATQHTAGLGDPDHVISVNLDGSCPMMAMADLAIVSDAREVLAELAKRLGV